MFIEGEGHDIIWHHPSPGCQMFCDIVSSWHRDNVQWQPPGGDDDICSHPVTSNCNLQSPGAPCIFWVEIIVFLTSRMGRAWTINVITQLRTHNNILGSSLCPRGKPQMTACSRTISPLIMNHDRLSPSWWHTAIASSPSQSRVLTTETWWWVRWDDQLFIWTMHVDDEDRGSIRVLLINSIWQSKYCWQCSSDQVMFSCFEPNQCYHVSPLDLSHSDDDGLLLRPEVTPVWGHSPQDTRGHQTRQAHIRSSGESVKSKEWHSRCESHGVTSAFTFRTRAPLVTCDTLLPHCSFLVTPVVRLRWPDTGRGKQGAGHLIICLCFVSSEIFDRMSVTFWALVCKCIFTEFSSTQTEIREKLNRP